MLRQTSEYISAALVSGRAVAGPRLASFGEADGDLVVVRPEYMGICRADIKEMRGARDIPTDRGPLFGHELVGPVVSSGTETGLSPGDIVTFNPNITPDRTTGFSELFFVRGTRFELSEALVKVPEKAFVEGIWMPEPFACIVHATNMIVRGLDVSSLNGKKIGIISAGCAGLMFAMCTKNLGAEVTVFNRGDMRRDFARGRRLLQNEENQPLDELNQYENIFDAVVVAPTIVNSYLLQAAAASLKDNALIFVYGGTRAGQTFPSTNIDIDAVRRQELLVRTAFGYKNIFIAGAYGCSKADYEEGFRLRQSRPDRFPLEALVSQQVPFSDFPALINAMAYDQIDLPGKVVVRSPAKVRQVHSEPARL